MRWVHPYQRRAYRGLCLALVLITFTVPLRPAAGALAPATPADDWIVYLPSVVKQAEPTPPTPTATASPVPSAPPPPGETPPPTSPPVPPADLADVVLLYAGQKSPADLGFERVAAYYGLRVAALNLASTALTDSGLRDEAGAYYRLAFGDGARLDSVLDAAERQVLQQAANAGGLNVLVTNLRQANSLTVQALTAGEIIGSASVPDTAKDYALATSHPALTRELTGLKVTHASDPDDYALDLAANRPHSAVLIQAAPSQGQPYAVFAAYQAGLGVVAVASNATANHLATAPLRSSFDASGARTVFRQQWFSEIMPLMMFVRYAAGDEAWHSDRDYANFTLDDPPLQASAFNFAGIAAEARAHNFHFTLALPAARGLQRDAAVVELFRANPAHLSLTLHGNNHDGYEFYKYTTTSGDPYPARPLADQVADLLEAEARRAAFSVQTGLPVARAMVFPYNISPAQTLVQLKAQNFLATINSANVPLDRPRADAWDAEMYPAEMSYASFPVILRYHAQAAPYPFDLFLDRPAWLYEHKEVFQESGIGWLSPIADEVNALSGTVEWRSHDYILQHLYHEKQNDDGSWAVRFWTNTVTVANPSSAARTYRFQREEAQNVAIVAVTLNGAPVPFTLSDGWLRAEALIPAGAEGTLQITYGP